MYLRRSSREVKTPVVILGALVAWAIACAGGGGALKDDHGDVSHLDTADHADNDAGDPVDTSSGDPSTDPGNPSDIHGDPGDDSGGVPDPGPPSPVCPTFLSALLKGNLESDLITEASGLVSSRTNPGVMWVHNDSGGKARVFAMDETGKHLGTYGFPGTIAVDWEDMAADDTYLYVADIGDNFRVRASVKVYRAKEPAVAVDQEPVEASLQDVESFELLYPDQAHDAETLLVDPVNGDLYVVTKDFDGGSLVFLAAAPLDPHKPIDLELVTDLQLPMPGSPTLTWTATGGDTAPDGSAVILTGYAAAFWWERPEGVPLWKALVMDQCPAPLALEAMIESVAMDQEGLGYFTVPEGIHAPVHYHGREIQEGSGLP